MTKQKIKINDDSESCQQKNSGSYLFLVLRDVTLHDVQSSRSSLEIEIDDEINDSLGRIVDVEKQKLFDCLLASIYVKTHNYIL